MKGIKQLRGNVSQLASKLGLPVSRISGLTRTRLRKGPLGVSYLGRCPLGSAQDKDTPSSWIEMADALAHEGKVRSAEQMYKKIIKTYPQDREAYDRLWCSWVRHRSLKVTGKELDKFIADYERNICTEDDSASDTADTANHQNQ